MDNGFLPSIHSPMQKIAFILVIGLLVNGCDFNDTRFIDRKNTDDAAAYLLAGDSIAKMTFDTLRTTLLKAIREKGLSGALAFCNTRALPVTGTYASEVMTVSRVSDKNRNSKNVLSEYDKKEWAKYIGLAAKKDSLRSIIVYRNHEYHYYKPIIIQPMCLSCHGTPGKDIPKDLLQVIDSLYPGDKAKGYKQGDLRGMWHIVFMDQKAERK
jgi:hypothetical protein